MSVHTFVSTDSFYCQDGAPFAVLERVEFEGVGIEDCLVRLCGSREEAESVAAERNGDFG